MKATPFFEVQTLDVIHGRMAQLSQLPCETVSLEAALGRTLAQNLVAPHDLPGFQRATMDGYAVRSRDTFGASETSPTYLTLVGEVLMGAAPDVTLASGECARIGTGGMLPKGADGVVMVEHTRQVAPQSVEVARAVPPGGNVTGAADDAAQGQTLLSAGHRLRPQDIGLLAAMGVVRPEVIQRPRLGIISTGDEVVPAEQHPAPGQVRDVNTHTLCALAREAGAEPQPLGLVPDQEDALRRAVEQALDGSDLLLLSGGSSVGIRDLTCQVFLSVPGAELLAHGVNVAPGKPFIWVRAGHRHLFGLPGQVTSCVIAFHLFVEPMVERMLGRPARSFTQFSEVQARLTRNLPSPAGREAFMRVDLRRDDAVPSAAPGPRGQQEPQAALLAEPLFGRSGLLRTLTQGKGLVRVPLGCEGLEAGSVVPVLRFPGGCAP